MSHRDRDTRARVMAAASGLFAAHGFKKVTVRAICEQAGANIAAVNYHFGDKLGLYREVLLIAIETMRGTTDAARAAGEGKPAEVKLYEFIRVFLHRVAHQGRASWIHQLMQREMADPTPALDLVIEQVVRPRIAYLSEVVADILGVSTDDERVAPSVLSVQAQCLAAVGNALSRRLMPHVEPDGPALARLTDHIARFSLGGVRALAGSPGLRGRRHSRREKAAAAGLVD